MSLVDPPPGYDHCESALCSGPKCLDNIILTYVCMGTGKPYLEVLWCYSRGGLLLVKNTVRVPLCFLLCLCLGFELPALGFLALDPVPLPKLSTMFVERKSVTEVLNQEYPE